MTLTLRHTATEQEGFFAIMAVNYESDDLGLDMFLALALGAFLTHSVFSSSEM